MRRGRDEGAIYQRASDSRSVGAVTISRPGQPRRRRSVVRATRKEVQTALRDLQRDLETGIVPAGRHVTVRAFLEAWLIGAEPKLRARTHVRYGELLRQHVIPEIGGLQLAKLAPTDVRTLLATLSKKPTRTGRPLSAQTVVHARAVLRRALSDAVGDGLIVRNPAAGKTVNPPTPKRHAIEATTPTQARAIVEAVRDDPLGPLYRLLLWTGLRLGEALGLRWSDVDLDRGWIRVRQTYGIVAGVGGFDEPKTAQSRRDVPIIDDARAALHDQKRRQAESHLLVGQAWTEQGLVFTGPLGEPLDPRTAPKRLHVLLGPIGLGAMRAHDLRHAYVTLLIRQGVSIPAIAKLVGHASPVMTLNVYGHVAEDSLAEAAGRLNDLAAGS
jgi:integrase